MATPATIHGTVGSCGRQPGQAGGLAAETPQVRKVSVAPFLAALLLLLGSAARAADSTQGKQVTTSFGFFLRTAPIGREGGRHGCSHGRHSRAKYRRANHGGVRKHAGGGKPRRDQTACTDRLPKDGTHWGVLIGGASAGAACSGNRRRQTYDHAA